MDPTAVERLHGLLMDLTRVAGLLHPDQALPGQPVSLSQGFALHELDTDDDATMSQQDLAIRLGLEKSTVSRMVADLELKGLVVRERDPANRRLYRLRLTAAGRTLHRRMGSEFHERYERLAASMTSAELDALLIGLPALVRALRQA